MPPGTKGFMLGLGIRELILSAIVVAVVWYGFKIVNRHKNPDKTASDDGVTGNVGGSAVELQPCSVCGVYMVPGSSECDCPNSNG